jgi:hypothetical protein
MSDNELAGYYVIKAENLITLTKTTNRNYYISCDLIQEAVISTDIDLWEQAKIYRLMNYFTSVRNVMSLLDDIINKPSKESLRLTKKHNIDGFLVEEPILQQLNALLLVVEAYDQELDEEQKKNSCVH